MWYLTTLSMPNRPIEPHGKVMASATPRSSMSRASGAEACTLVPPSAVTIWPMVLVAGRTFMPLMSDGSVILVREWKVPGSCTNAKQYFTSFISFAA